MRVVDRVLARLRGALLGDIHRRLEHLERHAFNKRLYAVEQIAEYLIGAQIPGDYLEFGVWQGATFSYAFRWLAPHFSAMRFIAFDSFEGLPAPYGLDAIEGYSSNFHKGDFACTEPEFLRRLELQGVDLSRVVTLKGWFDQALTRDAAAKLHLEHAALAWIDCDLYESAVPVLSFVTNLLSNGSVVVFDDWRCFRNDPGRGVQRACREWLDKHPQFELHELLSFGWNGIAFTVRNRERAE